MYSHAVRISISCTIPRALGRLLTESRLSSRREMRSKSRPMTTICRKVEGPGASARNMHFREASRERFRGRELLYSSLWKRHRRDSPSNHGVRRESIAARRGDPSEIKSSCRAADLHPLFTTSGQLFAVERYFTARCQNVFPLGVAAAEVHESRSIARVSRRGDPAIPV